MSKTGRKIFLFSIASHFADCAHMFEVLVHFDIIVNLLHLHIKVFIYATRLI